MGLLTSLSWLEATVGLCLFGIIYASGLVVYRLWFSPIARFPGPFMARVTFWYEFYYNWVHTGSYYLKIKQMHQQYGPIVRVTPNELHINEPMFYHKLFVYGAVRRTESYPRFGQGTGFEDMIAISTDHDMHRQARAPLEPFFSMAGITRVEPRVLDRVKKLGSRLQAAQNTNEVINLTYALSSLTTDVISSVIFEEPSDYLSAPDFNEKWYDILKKGTLAVPVFAHLPWITRLVASPMIKLLFERFTKWTVWDDKARRQILLSKKRPSDIAKTREETTVFDHLVHSDLVEAQFGNGGFARLAQLIQQAGAHNVSHTLGTILTYLLMDEEVERSLRQELEPIFVEIPDGSPTWKDLEKLPYISAVIKEGLRMAIGGLNRTPRVSPDVDLQFQGRTIPRGTPISMSTYWMHMDPAVFPEPEKFKPERWLIDEPAKLKIMQSYYVPFARGSRNCIGQNLVHMEMYHTLAHLFRPGSPRLSLYETDESDVIPVHGLLFPLPKLSSKGVRVLIH